MERHPAYLLSGYSQNTIASYETYPELLQDIATPEFHELIIPSLRKVLDFIPHAWPTFSDLDFCISPIIQA